MPEKDQAEVSANVKKLKKLRVKMVTPIILATRSVTSVLELESGATVKFDFDGDGRRESWSWIQPEAGFLVWTGSSLSRTRITDGAQMFGNHSFNLIWEDGFQPLAALDDNRNGTLEGGELSGLAVWFDLDSDGHSEPGELTSLLELGVAKIATKATDIDHGVATNPMGIEFTDGCRLPIWDWMAKEQSR